MVDNTLDERENTYGNYLEQTKISNRIKKAMTFSTNYENLAPDQADALMMIAVKVSRILNGDPDYPDNWHDIAGYATLVHNRLKEEYDE